MTQTQHYEKFQNLIHKAAWDRCRKNPGLSFGELVGEGNLAYCEALQTWNPNKGQFSTHLTWRLRHHLGRANSQTIDHDNHTTALDDGLQVADPKACGGMWSALENLGAEAREVVGLILGSAGELADFTMGSVKVTQGQIRSSLRSKGWSWRTIESAMTEIKVMLRSL
jgi:hypothetical protein